MKLKKILAVVSAAVLMGALSLPVFAEATPGQDSQDIAMKLIGMTQDPEMNVAEAEQTMKELTGNLQNTEVTLSAEMMTAAMSFFDRMEDDDQENIHKMDVSTDEVAISYRSQNGDTMTVNSVSLDEESGKIVLDATGSNNGFGYAITVDLPSDTKVTSYKVTMAGANAQAIDAVVPVKGYEEGGVMHKFVTFWVPHFTTYELTAFTTAGASGEGSGNGNGSSGNNGNSSSTNNNNTQTVTSSQSASTQNTSAATSSVEAENPIKATGSDMNRTVFVVVALAVAAACGLGVASKKSRKSE